MDIGFEDSLPLHELLLDLGIARQAARTGPNPESLGGLALGQCEVPNAVLGHQPRRAFGYLLPQIG